MHYEKKKRNRIDRCNICGETKQLTWDHIPPKSCGNFTEVRFNALFGSIPKLDEYENLSQNGMKFRTICDDCNNRLLGKEFDPEMAAYTTMIESYVVSKLVLPDVLFQTRKINRLCRAIVGHMLAALPYYSHEDLIEVRLREFFLDQNALPPSDIKLLNWMYLYNSVVISRNFSVGSLDGNYAFPKGAVSVMSSFPVSYVLCSNEESCGLVDLFTYCTSNIEDEEKIPIALRSFLFPKTQTYRSFAWPCNVSDDLGGAGFILGVDEYIKGSVVGVKPVNFQKK